MLEKMSPWLTFIAAVLLSSIGTLTLTTADDYTVGKRLVISNNTSKCNDSSYTLASSLRLASYSETAQGFPEGRTRCHKNETSLDLGLNIGNTSSNDSCFDQLEDIIDFCQAAFVEDGKARYCLSVQDVNTTMNISNIYRHSDACKPVMEIKEQYKNFESILDRTLVGVYTKTCENKTVCLAAYTRWLCSIKLDWTLYQTENQTEKKIKPCLNICHEVLRKCPYYLPSEQQGDKTLIYGGYPAFDCPRPESLMNNPTYMYPGMDFPDCFGNSATHAMGATLHSVLVSLLVFVLVVLLYII